MLFVRNFKPSDLEMVQGWFSAQGEREPTLALLPLGSTFICEDSELGPMNVLAFLATNSSVAYLECFGGNPELKGVRRREAGKFIVDYCVEFGRQHGYKHLFCLSPNEKLRNYYESLGFPQTVSGLTAHSKEI